MRTTVMILTVFLLYATMVMISCGQETPHDGMVATDAASTDLSDLPITTRWIQWEITRLSVATVRMQSSALVEDIASVEAILQKLSDQECDILARGYVIQVNDPMIVREVCVLAGFHPGNSLSIDGGIIMATHKMTWSEMKCCWSGLACCPEKTKDN